MAKSLIGVEISEESVRAVEVSVGRHATLLAAAEVPLPSGAAKDSEILDAEAVTLALRQLWQRVGNKGKRVILGIGSRRILVREYSTQIMRPDLLRQALPYQVQDLLPVPADQAVLDFYPLGESAGQVHGLLVAAVSETVEGLIAVLKRTRVETDTVDLVPFGLARASKIVAGPGETAAMIHVGEHTSYVVVAVDGVPRFVRIIPIDIPAAALVPEIETVQEMELVPPTRARAALRGGTASDPAVSDLISRLRSTIAFYGNRPGSTSVDSVYVSGAGAANPAVIPALTNVLDVPVRAVSASDLVATRGQAPQGAFAMSLVSTIGLVLGGN